MKYPLQSVQQVDESLASVDSLRISAESAEALRLEAQNALEASRRDDGKLSPHEILGRQGDAARDLEICRINADRAKASYESEVADLYTAALDRCIDVRRLLHQKKNLFRSQVEAGVVKLLGVKEVGHRLANSVTELLGQAPLTARISSAESYIYRHVNGIRRMNYPLSMVLADLRNALALVDEENPQ